MLLAVLLSLSPWACEAVAPVPGDVVAAYAPEPPFGGHWGLDLAASPGDVAAAPVAGTVTFAGSVAGVPSVTISAGGGLAVTVSYVEPVVARGMRVRKADPVGFAAAGHGGVHLSVRVDGRYLDPARLLECRLGSPARALRLASLCWRGCDAGSSAARSIRPTWHTWLQVRRPIGRWDSTWSTSSRPARRGRRPSVVSPIRSIAGR